MAQTTKVVKIRRTAAGTYFYTYETILGNGVTDVQIVDIGNTALQAFNEVRDLAAADVPSLGDIKVADITIVFGNP